jgi:Domain of unknown function (DUF4232)
MNGSSLGRRGWYLAGTLVAVSWLVAACGSGGSPQAVTSASVSASAGLSTAPSHTTAPVTSASPASPSAPTSASAPASPSASAPPGAVDVATCSITSLALTVDDTQADAGAGNSYYPLNFTNTSGATCEMYGFPGVSFVTAPTGQGEQVGAAALRGDAFAKVAILLHPRGSAHAWLKVATAVNYPASACHPVTVHWLRVYPPGETAAGYVGHAFTACSSESAPLLTVLPVRSGDGVVGTTP